MEWEERYINNISKKQNNFNIDILKFIVFLVYILQFSELVRFFLLHTKLNFVMIHG